MSRAGEGTRRTNRGIGEPSDDGFRSNGGKNMLQQNAIIDSIRPGLLPLDYGGLQHHRKSRPTRESVLKRLSEALLRRSLTKVSTITRDAKTLLSRFGVAETSKGPNERIRTHAPSETIVLCCLRVWLVGWLVGSPSIRWEERVYAC